MMTYPSETHVGKCIKMAHAATDIPKAAVAKDLGIWPQQYSKVLKQKDPKVHLVMGICNSMKLSLEELVSYGDINDSDRREEPQEL